MIFRIKLVNQRLCNGLYSEDEVTENIDLFPEECSGCHGKIFEESVTSVQLHQMADITEISPNMTQ